jgi:DNA-binding CsgD family transcriptional regulator
LADALNNAVQMAQLQGKKFQKSDNQAVLHELTDKQIEMMRLVASGLSNSEIAKRQWMTEAAVEKAITRLIKNLKLESSKEQNQRVMIASTYHQFTGSVNVRTDN